MIMDGSRTVTRFALNILEAERSIECRADQSVLDACLAAGLPFPYNCRSGECGKCVARLIEGEVHHLPGADPAVFNETHRAQGLLLTCLGYPRSDLTLSVAMRAESGPAIREFNTVVQEVRRHGPAVAEVVVRADAPVDYHAGQYFEWVLPGIAPNRCYSAANRAGTPRLEFHVRIYEGGRISGLVSSGRLMAGDILTLRGPFGTFRLSEDDQRPAILVAGGTGLAPIKALLEDAFARRCPRSLRFFYGTRRAADLYHTDTMAAWARQHRNFSFIPALSDEPLASSWTGLRSLVTDAIARQPTDAFGAEAYLCGPPPMIDAAIGLLERLGVDRTDIRYDKFNPVS
ncbi:MAG: 2Fe-2S iron-sulfur cluster-binding protein [Mycobacterium sp.]